LLRLKANAHFGQSDVTELTDNIRLYFSALSHFKFICAVYFLVSRVLGSQRLKVICILITFQKCILYFAPPHTHTFNGPFSGTTQVSRYQKSKTNLDFTEARDSEWQWHQLGHMQVCALLQTDNHASTPPLCFLQAGCPSCRPTNSIKALKAQK